ncbi:MAG: hypothetical protein VX291_02960 [Gemmatimonadota bacterium]|jgi:hypothetical protein|uniref:Uncharacterized protein n=1 Tax=marine metagenome TaxID=408172 RepID=A0A382SP04_9ZZZZ|nr:hypothetical protein [Gemmatimonadota bacterium]|tara:strand:- start:194 stop:406 length:213 start_codon:yes stop_codon:yes gene_type:complete
MRINPWWIAGFVMLMALLPMTYKLVVGLIGFGFMVNRVLTRVMGLMDTGIRVKEMVDDLNENEIIIEDTE